MEGYYFFFQTIIIFFSQTISTRTIIPKEHSDLEFVILTVSVFLTALQLSAVYHSHTMAEAHAQAHFAQQNGAHPLFCPRTWGVHAGRWGLLQEPTAVPLLPAGKLLHPRGGHSTCQRCLVPFITSLFSATLSALLFVIYTQTRSKFTI